MFFVKYRQRIQCQSTLTLPINIVYSEVFSITFWTQVLPRNERSQKLGKEIQARRIEILNMYGKLRIQAGTFQYEAIKFTI